MLDTDSLCAVLPTVQMKKFLTFCPDFASCESGDYLRFSCFNHVWCKNYLLKTTVKHYLLSWSGFNESSFKYGFGFSVFFQLFISQFQLWVFGEDFTFTWWWLFCSTMYMLECFTVWFTNLLLRILWVRYNYNYFHNHENFS